MSKTYAVNRIREIRKSKVPKLTLKALGQLMPSKLTLSHVGMLERGQRALSLDYILEFASALHVSPAAIIGVAETRRVPIVEEISLRKYMKNPEQMMQAVPLPWENDSTAIIALAFLRDARRRNIFVDMSDRSVSDGQIFAVLLPDDTIFTGRAFSNPHCLNEEGFGNSRKLLFGIDQFDLIGKVIFSCAEM